jgi:hypothetical protein
MYETGKKTTDLYHASNISISINFYSQWKVSEAHGQIPLKKMGQLHPKWGH